MRETIKRPLVVVCIFNRKKDAHLIKGGGVEVGWGCRVKSPTPKNVGVQNGGSSR